MKLAALAALIVINGDMGGRVAQYALDVQFARITKAPVEFAGACQSACTLYLSLPHNQTCIRPGAWFGFHEAYGATPEVNDLATRYMLSQYPLWVRRWIKRNGGLRSGIIRMNYTYAARYIRQCKPERGGQEVKEKFAR